MSRISWESEERSKKFDGNVRRRQKILIRKGGGILKSAKKIMEREVKRI